MKASKLDKKFDSGKEDITKFIDLTKAKPKRPILEIKQIKIDFPEWMLISLDQEAIRLGVTRQALIKCWIADKLALHQHSN